MKVETAPPLFSFLDGGLFIHQANTLVERYDLRHRWEKPTGDLFFGPRFGWLDNRQILRLLTDAISRLTDASPHALAGQDYWVHGTIHALYRGFCRSFLERFPHQPEEHTLLLTSFLERVVENYLGQTLTIEYSALDRERWKFLIDAGERLLACQYPMARRGDRFEAPPPRGHESELVWLEEASVQLRTEIIRLTDYSAVDQPSIRLRPGRPKARRASCGRHQSAW